LSGPAAPGPPRIPTEMISSQASWDVFRWTLLGRSALRSWRPRSWFHLRVKLPTTRPTAPEWSSTALRLNICDLQSSMEILQSVACRPGEQWLDRCVLPPDGLAALQVFVAAPCDALLLHNHSLPVCTLCAQDYQTLAGTDSTWRRVQGDGAKWTTPTSRTASFMSKRSTHQVRWTPAPPATFCVPFTRSCSPSLLTQCVWRARVSLRSSSRVESGRPQHFIMAQ